MEYRCKTCNALLMNTKGYSVCSEGCGGLLPKLPKAAAVINHARIIGVPEVEHDPHKNVYRIPGDDEEYVKARKFNRVLDSSPKQTLNEKVVIYCNEVIVINRVQGETDQERSYWYD